LVLSSAGLSANLKPRKRLKNKMGWKDWFKPKIRPVKLTKLEIIIAILAFVLLWVGYFRSDLECESCDMDILFYIGGILGLLVVILVWKKILTEKKGKKKK